MAVSLSFMGMQCGRLIRIWVRTATTTSKCIIYATIRIHEAHCQIQKLLGMASPQVSGMCHIQTSYQELALISVSPAMLADENKCGVAHSSCSRTVYICGVSSQISTSPDNAALFTNLECSPSSGPMDVSGQGIFGYSPIPKTSLSYPRHTKTESVLVLPPVPEVTSAQPGIKLAVT
ncbi:hypothetical protein LX36DRAFT_432954 [Colletotrichum falcatum]|nr:hypothetical protein LX36DRAFT_432954 [Colletotrichum falcatum]